MRQKVQRTLLLVGLAVIILMMVSISSQLSVAKPTGPYNVGQTTLHWVDSSRSEDLTENPDDVREVVALVWYPAEQGNEGDMPYFPSLSTVSKSLMESGEVSAWEVYGLRFIRSHNSLDAKPAQSKKPYPIVIFSPGNGTNAELYTVLASELASHGYVVVGLNHPYDVAAVELSNHEVAQFYKEQWSMDMSAHAAFIAERIQVRTDDVLFALNQLEALNSDVHSLFAGVLDVDSVAVAGHSLGGITASQACKADSRFRACLNLDGLQMGGPFSTDESAIPPVQPFLFLTKEAQLHPKLIEKFESTTESYWVVIHRASHQSFTDGPSLRPGLLPLPTHADQILTLTQKYTLAFLNQTLKKQPSDLLSELEKVENITVQVYPSQ
jgi:dienelactone hydrolase